VKTLVTGGTGFLGAHLIHRFVHMLQHMEAVQDMEGLSDLARVAAWQHRPAGLSRDVLEIANIEMDALRKHSARRRFAVQAIG